MVELSIMVGRVKQNGDTLRVRVVNVVRVKATRIEAEAIYGMRRCDED